MSWGKNKKIKIWIVNFYIKLYLYILELNGFNIVKIFRHRSKGLRVSLIIIKNIFLNLNTSLKTVLFFKRNTVGHVLGNEFMNLSYVAELPLLPVQIWTTDLKFKAIDSGRIWISDSNFNRRLVVLRLHKLYFCNFSFFFFL